MTATIAWDRTGLPAFRRVSLPANFCLEIPGLSSLGVLNRRIQRLILPMALGIDPAFILARLNRTHFANCLAAQFADRRILPASRQREQRGAVSGSLLIFQQRDALA